MQSGEQIAINGQRYQLGAVLSTGSGSYGQVWAAIDGTQRAVALKFINTEAMFQADPSLRGHWREHLEREIDFLKKLRVEQSRHIVTLFDHGQIAGQPVLVMERLQANLGQWLTQRAQEDAPPLELDLILDWAGQILAGLEVIHDAGFVYRDLKLSNILVGDDGNLLKLADFGSLKRETGDSTRSFIGTPATMAPEQVLPVGQSPEGYEYAVDYRADYYALGLLLFTLITERPSTEAQRRLGHLLAVHGQHGASQQRAQLGGLSEEEREVLRRSIEFWTIPALPEYEQSGIAAPLTGLIEQLLACDPSVRPVNGDAIRAVLHRTRADPSHRSTAPIMMTVTPDWIPTPASASTPQKAGAPHQSTNPVIPDWMPPLQTGPSRRHAHRSATPISSPWLRRSAGLVGVLGLASALAWTLFLAPSNPTQPQEVRTPDIVSTLTAPKAVAPATSLVQPDASTASTAPTIDKPEPTPAPAAPEPPAEETTSVADNATPPEEATSVADNAAPPEIEPEPEPDPAAGSEPTTTLAGSEATESKQSAEPEEPEEPPVAATPTTPQEKPDSLPVATTPTSTPSNRASTTTQKATSSNRSRSANTAKATRTAPTPVPTPKERVERAPTAPTPDSRVAKPVTKAPASTASTTPTVSPPVQTRRPSTKSVSRSTTKGSAATKADRTAKTTPSRPTPPPPQPTVASTKPPVVHTKTSAAPSTQAKAPAPSAPADLPPINLIARPQPASIDLPPIKLIGQSHSTTGTSTVKTQSQQAQTTAKSTKNQATDSRSQFQRDVDQVSRWVGRTGAAVGSEVRRGLESVGQAISGNSGNSGTNRAQVERRDQWEPRYSER